MKVYHYTSAEGYRGIIASDGLVPSDPWTADDSSYGTGWYFTELGPTHCDVCIAEACWKDASQVHKVRYYLEYEVSPPGTLISRCRQFVLMIRGLIGGLLGRSTLPVAAGWTWALGGDRIMFIGGGSKRALRCQKHPIA